MAQGMPQAVVIGGGTMGSGIALVFATAGWRTIVVEPREAGRRQLASGMADSIRRLGADPAKTTLEVSPDIQSVSWAGTQIVVESIVEDLEAKRRCFTELEQLVPEGIPLASNSTGYPISQIGGGLATRSRMIGLHFLMPAQFVPLVEIIPSEDTSPQTVAFVRDLMVGLGKRPVVLNKPQIGFLANRMQSALMREALSLIDRGIASPQDVDDAVRYSFGFRYVAAGPIMQKEHSGWEISMSLYEKVFPDLCNDDKPTPSLRAMVAAGKLGMKTKQGFFDWSNDDAVAREKARFEAVLGEARGLLDR